VSTGLGLTTGKEMKLFKSMIGDGRNHCDAFAAEGDEKGLLLARTFFASDLRFVFPKPFSVRQQLRATSPLI
jgi:hypothetical protein